MPDIYKTMINTDKNKKTDKNNSVWIRYIDNRIMHGIYAKTAQKKIRIFHFLFFYYSRRIRLR